MVGDVKIAGQWMNSWTGWAADKPIQSGRRAAKNAALMYTPAGAIARGYNKFSAARKIHEENIMAWTGT